MADWIRPNDIPYPTVWRKFQGKIQNCKNPREYFVQDLTEEYINQAIEYLIGGFIKDEPLCQFLDFQNDEFATDDLVRVYRDMLDQKLGLVCLTFDENGKKKMVGFNCTGRSYRGQPKVKCRSKAAQEFVDLEENYVPGYKKQYDILNIDHYLYAIGLYVSPEYRGEGIGLEILKAREDLCKAVGIPASCTLFTSKVSQILAEKAGFQDLLPFDNEKEDVSGKNADLKNIVKTYRYMYKLYQ